MSVVRRPPPPDSLLEQYRALLEVSEAIVSHRDLFQLFPDLAQRLRRVVRFDNISLILHDPERDVMRLHLEEAMQPSALSRCPELPVEASPGGWAWKHQKPLVIQDLEHETRWPVILGMLRQKGMRSGCVLPLTTAQRRVGAIALASFQASAYDEANLDFLQQVAHQVAVAVDNALAFQQIAELKDKLAVEKLYLEEELRTEHNFEEIIGQSPALTAVLESVRRVAPTDASVLITGETGTGKELIARALHSASKRQGQPFIKLNCAALPAGLVESELFGHERGAFSGALARRIGRFELADGGTLFLDEVGEIPAEVQVKLLRVLQDREFERVGGSATIRVDVRVVAATNRDLLKAVREQKFREDLYYRLNVFPLHLAPLRERKEDIPLLVRFLVTKFAARVGKRLDAVSQPTMDRLRAYSWPGNVRELENILERAVILATGPALDLDPDPLSAPKLAPAPEPRPSLETVERDYILKVLQESNWVIDGPRGAAGVLGIHPNTLRNRLKKLGIARTSHQIL